MNNPQVQKLADDLTRLSKEFVSQEAAQASALKKAFKEKSKNDLSRTVVYLMEVVGVSDMRIKTVQEENKDLRELLKLNNIALDGEDSAQEGQEANGVSTTSENDSSHKELQQEVQEA